MCMHCNSPCDVPKLKILHRSLWKTHLAFRDYSEQLYSSRLQKALLIHIFCLCCKYPKYSGKHTHYWLLLITVSSSIIFLSHKSILLLLSKIRKKMNIKELRNVFMISCSKRCMHNLNWEDNAFMQCISFLPMQYNVFLDENVGQRLIQNTEQNYSWSEGFSD